MRFVSSAMASVVAIGSLGIAFMQYVQAIEAQKAAAAAVKAESTQEQASNDAMQRVLPYVSTANRQKLLATVPKDSTVSSLENQVQTNPGNVSYRKQLLLRRTFETGETTGN